MFRQLFNWRTVLALIAILIVSGTIFYSQYLAKKIASEEKQKVEQWIEAGKFIIFSPPDADTRLASMITTENKSIPIIETDENDNPSGFYINLDSTKIAQDSNYLRRKVSHFKSAHAPVEWIDPKNSKIRNLYYYGNSKLLNEVLPHYSIMYCFTFYCYCFAFFKKQQPVYTKPGMGWYG
jgi:hypothetical protein